MKTVDSPAVTHWKKEAERHLKGQRLMASLAFVSLLLNAWCALGWMP
jgi:hypothetical protein